MEKSDVHYYYKSSLVQGNMELLSCSRQVNEVITKYKVEGIPTKFIIGPDQNIKFKSVGFSGNVDQMVKEIQMMIDLAKG